MNTVEKLAEVEKHEPQPTYALFTKSVQFRWSYFQQVLYDDGTSLTKLNNETIRYPFIPYLFDNHVTENEADLSSLPVKKGGL